MTYDIALQVGVYSDSIDTQGNRVVFAKAIDSLSLWGVDNDSVIYNNTKNVSTLKLPLQNTQAQTRFAMIINGQTDTLIVNHKNNDIFVSLDCGCFTFHTIDDISETAHIFDSIAYIEYEIGRTPTENIQLFWH